MHLIHQADMSVSIVYEQKMSGSKIDKQVDS